MPIGYCGYWAQQPSLLPFRFTITGRYCVSTGYPYPLVSWYRCWWLFQVRCCWRVGSTFLTCCNAALLCVLLPLLLR
ncbi:Uncharacterised protein [Vibrio cholerae]|nr:Uncharacterised protein [Vibrio cholerae]